MKALCKKHNQPGLWLVHDAEKPTIGYNEVLIKIEKTAICGTDIHIYNWDNWAQATIPVPVITGHEYYGRIVEVGEGVVGLKEGDRVSGEGHLVCSHCRNCRAGKAHLCNNATGVGITSNGAFAEFLAINAYNVFKIPDNISDNLAAILDPAGNALHTALSFDLSGEDVLVTGAGPIGIMAASICKFVGARNVVLTDINDYRLNLAKQVNPDILTVNVQHDSVENMMKQLNMQEGFDVCLEISGVPSAIQTILKTINYGGKVALLGIPSNEFSFDFNAVIFKGLSIKGIYGREMFETWYKTTSLIQAGLQLQNIITHELHVDDFETGFELMKSGRSGKIILNW